MGNNSFGEAAVEAFFSLGTPVLERLKLFATPSGLEVAKAASMDFYYAKKDKSKVDLLQRATVLSCNADGSIPNAQLLPSTALVLCVSSEAAMLKGHWLFVLA